MILKNSFLASLKENNKRRIWLWIVAVFVFALMFPSVIMMLISQHTNRTDYFFEVYGEALGQKMMQESLIEELAHVLDIGYGNSLFLVVAAFAILSGVQGFSFLYHKRKIDFYMGMPVRRKKRFLIIWLNGVLVYAIPCLAGVIISLLIVATNGALTDEIMLGTWQSYGILLCMYLGVYHLVILAVMLTGNIIITGFAIGVLFLYGCIVRVIIMGCMDLFYKFYSGREYTAEPVLSPFTMLFDYVKAYGNQKENVWQTMVGLLVFAAVAGVTAYICYLKRPAEAAGKAIAFSKPKPILKIMIAVPVSLMAGLFTADIVGYDPLYGKNNYGVVFFVMVVALLFACCLMQVIYEFDIKGILHKKRHILVSAVIVVITFIVFRYDICGFDKYIPSVDKVESAAVSTPSDSYLYYGSEFWDEEMNYMSKDEYVEEYMYLTDVGAVNQLMKRSMELVNQYENMNLVFTDTKRGWRRIQITYRMEDKRKVCREILVDLNDEETVALIDRLEASKEYIAGSVFGVSDMPMNTLENMNLKVTAYYGNGTYKMSLTREETKELLAHYREDALKGSFLKYQETVPIGSLCIGIEERKSYYSTYRQAEMLIYPFYEECVAYLSQKGCYMEHYVRWEDVEKIQVINHHYERKEKTYTEEAETDEYFEITEIYTKPEDIVTILEKIYPQDYLSVSWHGGRECEDNYAVKVYFKQDSEATKENEGFEYYVFEAGNVPDFVEVDTAYKP